MAQPPSPDDRLIPPAPVLLPRLAPAPDMGKLAFGGSLLESRILAELPAPLAPSPAAVEAWFTLMETLRGAPEKQGLTARQLARRLGPDWDESFLSRLLERLVTRGDLVRKDAQPPRYQAHPYHRVLSTALRTQAQRQSPHWEAFDLATLAYAERRAALEWRELKEAFTALVDTLPGWPATVLLEAKADIDRWVCAAADVAPPSFVIAEDEWTAMRRQNDELEQTLMRLQDQLKERPSFDPAGGKKGALKARAQELETENEVLRQRVTELETLLEGFLEELEDDTYAQFLEGKGRGALPESLPREEVARVRALVLDTRAERPILLAIARKLGDVFRQPLRYTRLTSQAFRGHTHDSLWRARVAGYRITYGVTRERVTVLEIGPRDTVYGDTVRKL